MLMESIVSILLLTMLMATVHAMIQTSLRMTANSMEDAREIQGDFNPVLLNQAINIQDDVISISITSADGINISTSHNVRIFDDTDVNNNLSENIVAFYPGGDGP